MLIEEFDKSRHKPENIKELLSMAVGSLAPQKLEQLVDELYMSESHTLFVGIENDQVVGVIGIDYSSSPHGFINHIAVVLDMQKQGIGSQLIKYASADLKLKSIEAETDQDAVDFYQACGFRTEEIESQYPGVRRFLCTKRLTNPE